MLRVINSSALALVLIESMCPFIVLGQNAASRCDVIITQGLREYSISSYSEANLNTVFDNYCEANGTAKAGGFSASLDAVVKAIPIKFTLGASSTEDSFRNFCKTYSSVAQQARSGNSYQEKIVSKAYDAFNECVRFSALGIGVEHNIVNREASSFFFWAGVGRPIEIRGVNLSNNVTCNGQSPEGRLIPFRSDTRTKSSDSLGFVCRRAAQQLQDGTRVYEEGTIQIITNVGRYDVFLPRDTLLPDNAASDIRKTVVDINTRLMSVNARVDGLHLVETPVSTLPEFACGNEAIASTALTFMVGSRDGTGCGVTNRNYVKRIDLSIPPSK